MHKMQAVVYQISTIPVNQKGFSHLALLGCSEWGSFTKEIFINYCDGRKETRLLEMKYMDSGNTGSTHMVWKGATFQKIEKELSKPGYQISLNSTLFDLDPNSEVESITLPDCPAMHIFSMTLCG